MKQYRGARDAAGTPHVYVADPEAPDGNVEYRLRHNVRHSPDGFEWGYAGSGPTELARCILIDHYYDRGVPPLDGGEVPFVNPSIYQRFKEGFIAPLDRDAAWVIPGVEIDRWLVKNDLTTPAEVEAMRSTRVERPYGLRPEGGRL